MEAYAPAVEFSGVQKRFGDCIAVQDLNFSVRAGSIHAIVGENGAGKSTAMKMLFGLYPPNAGQIKVHGQAVDFASPTEAMNLGIGMVHQHFMLAETLTALENILLFQKNTRGFTPLERKKHQARLQSLASEYQFDIPWDVPVYKLSVGTQQRIEILKILSQDSKVIILDEPTAVLTPQEIEDLFRNLEKLKREGRTILIITHKLKEVMRVADRVTVFRAGLVVHDCAKADTSVTALAEAMVGRTIKNLAQSARATFQGDGTKMTAVTIRNLSVASGHGNLHDVSFEVRPGEIVGIAGVEGNGQDPLIHVLLNPKHSKADGEISIRGVKSLKLSALAIRALGVAAFPEDRLRFGVMSDRPLFENFILGYHRTPEFAKNGFLRLKAIRAATAAAMEKFDVRPRQIDIFMGRLSGGNQQKLVVARELQKNPAFILAAKPTRGVDIGAIEFIHEQILEARNRGAGVLLVSSELDELTTLSDQILVLFKGEIVAEFSRAQGFNEISLGAAMGGQTFDAMGGQA
jgi:simple sugar transport system ATP-binding protein